MTSKRQQAIREHMRKYNQWQQDCQEVNLCAAGFGPLPFDELVAIWERLTRTLVAQYYCERDPVKRDKLGRWLDDFLFDASEEMQRIARKHLAKQEVINGKH